MRAHFDYFTVSRPIEKRRLLSAGISVLVLVSMAARSSARAANVPPAPANMAFYTGEHGASSKGIDWVQSIAVSSPAYGADINGPVTVVFKAPGLTRFKVSCWQQPTAADSNPLGHDVDVVADRTLGSDGSGSFDFPADRFPNGPITIRIRAKDEGKKQDLCELQLYNRGGVVWNQGIPKSDPPGAKGLKLAFSDDFDGPLSITGDGVGARYEAHKPDGGDFSGWPFSSPGGENNPFGQEGTFLRIHASKKPGTKGVTGIISSTRGDKSGFTAHAPCYFECRFLAQSAPGTWPAFWLTSLVPGGCDELDIIEAYGGWGIGNPNWQGYAVTTHFWGQKDAGGNPKKGAHTDVPVMDIGGKSTWSTTFHTYGLLVTMTDTVYYFDNIEVFRHPTGELSKTAPFNFMINYAIGGISGWKIDLERYGNVSDMWVDFVRVYQGSGT